MDTMTDIQKEKQEFKEFIKDRHPDFITPDHIGLFPHYGHLLIPMAKSLWAFEKEYKGVLNFDITEFDFEHLWSRDHQTGKTNLELTRKFSIDTEPM